MSTSVVQILRDVRARLTDPRRWVQGHWMAHRDDRGVLRRVQPLIGLRANCWCLGQALSLAVNATSPDNNGVSWCELRSDAERELLTTLEARLNPEHVPAIYIWQDRREVSHADVLQLIDDTLERLAPVAA